MLKVVLICQLGLLTSCFDTQSLDVELDRTISIEAYQSSSSIRAIIFESTAYPCSPSDNCPPTIYKEAVMTTQVNGSSGKQLGCDPTNTFFFNDDLPIQLNDQITLRVTTPSQTFEASSISPDPSNLIVASEYQVSMDNPGLYILLDTMALKKSTGLYIQIVSNGRDSLATPRFGFLISNLGRRAPRLPNNGLFAQTNVYYIPHEEVMRTNVVLFKGEEYTIIVRNITSESAEFYAAFKRELAMGTISMNNGLFFAPPENLPTNFNNGAFGFFHLFHERLIEGIVQ